MDDVKRKRFLWGMLLAWVPVIPLVFSFAHAFFRGISEQKATGLGAVAGGLAEAYVTFGFFIALAFEVAAIILLGRAFSKENWMRSVGSVLSICLAGLTLSFMGLSLWLFLVRLPHVP
jgi:hypothetical protein